jgi:hypothetical protein
MPPRSGRLAKAPVRPQVRPTGPPCPFRRPDADPPSGTRGAVHKGRTRALPSTARRPSSPGAASAPSTGRPVCPPRVPGPTSVANDTHRSRRHEYRAQATGWLSAPDRAVAGRETDRDQSGPIGSATRPVALPQALYSHCLVADDRHQSGNRVASGTPAPSVQPVSVPRYGPRPRSRPNPITRLVSDDRHNLLHIVTLQHGHRSGGPPDWSRLDPTRDPGTVGFTGGRRAPLRPASEPYPPRAEPFATRTPTGPLPRPA